MHFSSPTFLGFNNGAALLFMYLQFWCGEGKFSCDLSTAMAFPATTTLRDTMSAAKSLVHTWTCSPFLGPHLLRKSSQLSGPALRCKNVCVIQSDYVYFSPFLSDFSLPSETWCIAVQVMDTHNRWCLQPAILFILPSEEDVLEEFKIWKEELAYSPTACHRNPVNIECIWLVFTNGITPSRLRLFILLLLW